MSQERLEAWFAGTLPSEELTVDEVLWLEHSVFEAVARKLATAQQPQGVQ